MQERWCSRCSMWAFDCPPPQSAIAIGSCGRSPDVHPCRHCPEPTRRTPNQRSASLAWWHGRPPADSRRMRTTPGIPRWMDGRAIRFRSLPAAWQCRMCSCRRVDRTPDRGGGELTAAMLTCYVLSALAGHRGRVAPWSEERVKWMGSRASPWMRLSYGRWSNRPASLLNVAESGGFVKPGR